MKEKLLNELAKDGPIDFDLFLSDEALKVIPELLDELLQERKDEEQAFIDKPHEKTEFDEGMKISRFSLLWRILFNHLDRMVKNPQLKQIITDFTPKVKAFSDDPEFVRNYYSKEYYEKLLWIKEHKNLTSEQKRILDLELPKYQQRGLQLSPEDQATLKELNQQIATIQNTIRENFTGERSDFMYTFEDDSSLQEMPKASLEQLKALGENGKVAVNGDLSLQAEILKYCTDPKIRKYFYTRKNAIASQGKYDNRKSIQTYFSLYQKKAHLLGYQNAGEMLVEGLMAWTPDNARKFIENLQIQVKKKAQEEIDFLKSEFWLDHLEAYDLAYYTRKYKEAHFQFNESQIKEYFEFNHVLSWLHNFVKEYFWLEFHKLDKSSSLGELWYEVKKEGKIIAYYFLDAFYRNNKRHGNWCDFWSKAYWDKPVIYNCCNITKPEQWPILLSLDDVQAIFHEFGHAVNTILSPSKYVQLASPFMERDFIEVPSTIMEFRAKEKEALLKLAQHYQTWESLSAEIVDQLNESEKFMMGNTVLRRNEFALVDNYLFTHDLPETIEEMDKKILEVVNENSVLPKGEEYKAYCDFLHIYDSFYACKYYSYMWADLYLSDIFQKIKKVWMFNHEILKEYCDKILSQWTCKPAEEMFRDFMGREVNPTAIWEYYGLQ